MIFLKIDHLRENRFVVTVNVVSFDVLMHKQRPFGAVNMYLHAVMSMYEIFISKFIYLLGE